MAQETLQVDAVGATTNWTLGAGASKVAAVNTPDDDDTSYIASGTTSGTTQQFTVANPSQVSANAVINFVRIVARCKRGGAQNCNFVVSTVLSASSTDGASQTGATSYANTQDDFTTKPGGGSWTLTDLQNLEIKIRNTQARDLRCTTFYVIVDYTPLSMTNLERRPLRGVFRGMY